MVSWVQVTVRSPSLSRCLQDGYLWCMKELRQVKISRGTMAHRVMVLLNLDSRTLRGSPSVWLTVWLDEEKLPLLFSRLVKYCRKKKAILCEQFKHFNSKVKQTCDTFKCWHSLLIKWHSPHPWEPKIQLLHSFTPLRPRNLVRV